MGPKVKKWRFSELFFSILALALHQPCRVRHFFAYSCSHRPYGSNGVSHDPNPAREKSLGGPEVSPVVKFWAQNFSKCLKKLQTAISRPLLVQMSWFFAWGFVVTYSVGKISHSPPTHPPAHPPGWAATRPTAFRQKLSDSADICRVGWQSYNSASYKKLALTELKRPRNRPANTIYSLRRALSRPFWFGLG